MKKLIIKLLLVAIILFSLLVGFSGCSSYYALTEVVTSPTQIFEYNGSVEESYSEVKKELFRNNQMAFSYEDRHSAILVTNIRRLFISEYYNLNLFFQNIPEIVFSNQEGSLFFLFTDLGNNKTKIELYTKTFVKIEGDTPPKIPSIYPQHPFLQNHIDIISKLPKISY